MVLPRLSAFRRFLRLQRALHPSASVAQYAEHPCACSCMPEHDQVQVPRVASGTSFFRLGSTAPGPGMVAAAYRWSRVLSKTEMDELLALGVPKGELCAFLFVHASRCIHAQEDPVCAFDAAWTNRGTNRTFLLSARQLRRAPYPFCLWTRLRSQRLRPIVASRFVSIPLRRLRLQHSIRSSASPSCCSKFSLHRVHPACEPFAVMMVYIAA